MRKPRAVLDAFAAWLHDQDPKALPKGALGEAVANSLSQWGKLESFMLDGRPRRSAPILSILAEPLQNRPLTQA
ncbi:MAG: IS66 family transposase [Bacillota bacterium]